MRGVLRAGVLYFAIIFTIGFGLGTIRVLLLVPRLGAVTSELLELLIILSAAWVLCDRPLGPVFDYRLCPVDDGGSRLVSLALRQFHHRSLRELPIAIRFAGDIRADHLYNFHAFEIGSIDDPSPVMTDRATP